MRYCDFVSEKGGIKACRVCGFRLRAESDWIVAVCGMQTPGFGDYAASALAMGYIVPSVKITPESYRRWKVRWGFADACNCGERKEKLNRFGRWVAKRREALNRWGRWLAKWR